MGERADDMTSQDPADIQADIDRTRDQMSETIDEIQYRLSPSHIQEEATQRVREATVGRVEQAGTNVRETGMTMWQTVRQNPLPAALIGVGIGWLYMSGSSSSQQQYGQSRFEPGSSAGQARQGVERAAGDVTQQAQELGSEMRERTGQMGERAQGQVQQMRGQFGQVFQDNPLALGVVAFGVGAAIGLAIPETRQEHQMMGEQRDQLMQQAKGTAQEKMQQAEQVAERTFEEARDTAEEEARQQGLRE